MMEILNPIESEDEQEEIDKVIYDNYQEFKPYIKIFEELVGPKNKAVWEEKYLEGHSTGILKHYRVEKDGLSFVLSVGVIDESPLDENLSCEITIR